MLERFPDSVYAPAAKYYSKELRIFSSRHEQLVIGFYDSKDKQNAAAARDKAFAERFGKHSAEFEATDYDKKASLAVAPIANERIAKAKETLNHLPAISASRFARSLNVFQKFLQKELCLYLLACDSNENIAIFTLSGPPHSSLGFDGNS